MAALIGIGMLLVPWRTAITLFLMLTLAANYAAAIFILSALGWLSFIMRRIIHD